MMKGNPTISEKHGLSDQVLSEWNDRIFTIKHAQSLQWPTTSPRRKRNRRLTATSTALHPGSTNDSVFRDCASSDQSIGILLNETTTVADFPRSGPLSLPVRLHSSYWPEDRVFFSFYGLVTSDRYLYLISK